MEESAELPTSQPTQKHQAWSRATQDAELQAAPTFVGDALNHQHLKPRHLSKWYFFSSFPCQDGAFLWNCLTWWTFRPLKKKRVFSHIPTPNSPIKGVCRHPPGPLTPPPERPPLLGFSLKKSTPPLPKALFDSPFPLPEQKKIKNIRNVHQA